MESFFVSSYARAADCRPDTRPEFACIGRSNVGKSSLINLLLGRKRLSKISSKPGKTRLLNLFSSSQGWLLMDMPGYGWAKCSKAIQAHMRRESEAYLRDRTNLACLMVLLDVRHKPQLIDLNFIRWAAKQGLPLGLVFTKADKIPRTQLQQSLLHYEETLYKDWEKLPPRFVSSSHTKRGREEILRFFAQTQQCFLDHSSEAATQSVPSTT